MGWSGMLTRRQWRVTAAIARPQERPPDGSAARRRTRARRWTTLIGVTAVCTAALGGVVNPQPVAAATPQWIGTIVATYRYEHIETYPSSYSEMRSLHSTSYILGPDAQDTNEAVWSGAYTRTEHSNLNGSFPECVSRTLVGNGRVPDLLEKH